MRTKPATSRGAYTAIELMVVLGIVSALSMMSAPSVVSAMRKASVSEGVDVIGQVATEARGLALRNQVKDDYYGVVVGVDANGQGYAALTYGQGATTGDILQAPNGDPVLKLELKRSVLLMVNGQPMTEADGTIGWMHQYTTGATVTVAAQSATPISVGTPGSPLCESMGVQTLDGAYKASFAVFPVGMGSFDVEAP